MKENLYVDIFRETEFKKKETTSKPPEMFSSTKVKGLMYCSFVLHDPTFILHCGSEKGKSTYDKDFCMLRWATQINE